MICKFCGQEIADDSAVKSSKSILAKCVMWLHIIMVIAAFIFMIYAFKECMDSCANATW